MDTKTHETKAQKTPARVAVHSLAIGESYHRDRYEVFTKYRDGKEASISARKTTLEAAREYIEWHKAQQNSLRGFIDVGQVEYGILHCTGECVRIE